MELNRAELHRMIEWNQNIQDVNPKYLEPDDAALLARLRQATLTAPSVDEAAPIDEQEWAQVEVFGHRRHFGRVTEVERFGSKMMRIDVPTADLAVFETYFYGGGSIFSMAPCTEAVARKMAEANRPRAYLPRAHLPAGMEDEPEPGDEC